MYHSSRIITSDNFCQQNCTEMYNFSIRKVLYPKAVTDHIYSYKIYHSCTLKALQYKMYLYKVLLVYAFTEYITEHFHIQCITSLNNLFMVSNFVYRNYRNKYLYKTIMIDFFRQYITGDIFLCGDIFLHRSHHI